MIVTNKMGLPSAIADAVAEGIHEPTEGRYGATELLKPTREIKLTRENWGEIECDCADSAPALLGTAFHSLMEERAPKGAESELELEWPMGHGLTLKGRLDLWDGECVTDYKTTSASKAQKGDFADWRKQALIYAWLLWNARGERARKARFVALLKDWSKAKAVYGSGYPQSPVCVVEFPILDSDIVAIGDWIEAKAEKLASDALPECTAEEMWEKPKRYAVYKGASARATKVCDTLEEAEALGGRIEERGGERTKCDLYCPVAKWCKNRKEV